MEDPRRKGLISALVNSSWFRWAVFIATLLGIAGFFLAIPPLEDALFGKRAALAVERVSEIPIVDMNRPLAGLKVEFQGQDLTAQQQGLVASQVQIRNTGDVSITPAKTTPLDPIGFEVKGGTVVRVTGATASSPHLRRFAEPKRSGNRVWLNPELIIEPGDYVRFNIWIAKPVGREIAYEPFGKVEGIPRIEFRDPLAEKEQVRFAQRAFGGDLGVQFVRLLTYSLAGLVLLALVVGTAVQLSDIGDRRRTSERSRLADKVLSRIGDEDRELYEIVADVYRLGGLALVDRVGRRLARGGKALDLDETDIEEIYPADVPIPTSAYHRIALQSAEVMILKRLIRSGYIDKSAGTVVAEVEKAFVEFRRCLLREVHGNQLLLNKIEPPPSSAAFVRIQAKLDNDVALESTKAGTSKADASSEAAPSVR